MSDHEKYVELNMEILLNFSLKHKKNPVDIRRGTCLAPATSSAM